MPLPKKTDYEDEAEFMSKIRLQGTVPARRLVRSVKLEQEGIIVGNDLREPPKGLLPEEDGP